MDKETPEGESKLKTSFWHRPITKHEAKDWAQFVGKWFLLPALFYSMFFVIFTWPLITDFSTHFFTGKGDGLQNVWNNWWVDFSITQEGTLPWYTTWLKYPHGTTMLGQTMNPINGMMGILLSPFFSPTQSYNFTVMFAFIFGGISAAWLAYEFSKAYIPSLLAGFIFTFSAYHFAHALGHMQLVTLEFLPLFLFLWWRFLKNQTYTLAVGAGLSLFLVYLSDHYYFFYSIITAAIMFFYMWRKNLLEPLKPEFLKPLATFIATVCLTSLPLALSLVWANHVDPFTGSHPVNEHAMDIFAPFIYGQNWRWHDLTKFYWNDQDAATSEHSVYLGITVIAILIFAFIKRKTFSQKQRRWLALWGGTLGLFWILSLGPLLKVDWHLIDWFYMPYAFLAVIFPPLDLSGVPVRMMVITVLGAAIVAAIVLSKLDLTRRSRRIFLGLFFAVLVLEMWPTGIPATRIETPEYVARLMQAPEPKAGVIDWVSPAPEALYFQTLHERPMTFGYISRTPKSVEAADVFIYEAAREGWYGISCQDHGVRYMITPEEFEAAEEDGLKKIYQSDEAVIYDLKGEDGQCPEPESDAQIKRDRMETRASSA